MIEAICPRCSTSKPTTEFYRNRSRAGGRSTYCKACTMELRNTRYREGQRTYQRAWHVANRDKARAKGKRYALAHPDQIRAKRLRQRAAKPEQYLAYARASDTNRRGREQGAAGHATTEQILARWAYYGGRCWMCGAVAVETDHVKPLSRGGSAWPANLRPACRRCNGTKHASWPYPLEAARARRAARGAAAVA